MCGLVIGFRQGKSFLRARLPKKKLERSTALRLAVAFVNRTIFVNSIAQIHTPRSRDCAGRPRTHVYERHLEIAKWAAVLRGGGLYKEPPGVPLACPGEEAPVLPKCLYQQ